MKKRFVCAVMLLVCVLTLLSGCNNKKVYDIKVGILLAGDESSSFYNEFVEASKTMRVGFELEDGLVDIRKNVSADDCSGVLKEFADDGCEIVIVAADFDRQAYESAVVTAAKKNKKTDFLMVGGERGHIEELDNYSAVYPAQYDTKYLAGIAVGMKLKEMIENGDITENSAKVGYVATDSGDEVSAYTAFYLGVNDEILGVPGVPMDVVYGGIDDESQAAAARELVDRGCIAIAQHTDTAAVAEVCAQNGVYNVGHGFSTLDEYPDTFLIATRFDWSVFFSTIYGYTDMGTDIEEEWTGSFKYDVVRYFDINSKIAAKDTDIKLDQMKAELLSGTRHVFDTSKFTLDSGKAQNKNTKTDKKGHLTGCAVDLGYDYLIQVVENGFFNESKERSYPYFNLLIDGITIVSE